MQKPLFQATTRITKEGCRFRARARAGQHRHVVWACNAVVALCAAALWAVNSPNAVWVTAMLAALVLYGVFRSPAAGLLMYMARHESVDSIHLAFDEEGITVNTRVEKSLIRYERVTDICADARFIMINMRHHTPLVFARTDVDGGKADELAAFLAERTGREVWTLK